MKNRMYVLSEFYFCFLHLLSVFSIYILNVFHIKQNMNNNRSQKLYSLTAANGGRPKSFITHIHFLKQFVVKLIVHS